MKVVHIVEALGGGVYSYFRDLSTFFGDEEIKKSIDTYIIYSANRKEINPKKIAVDFSSGVTLIQLNMVREFSLIQDIKSIIELSKALKKINPDVIHLHSSKAGVLGRIAYFFLFQKKKIFYSPHGYSFLRTDISAFHKKIYRLIEKKFQQLFGGITVACGDTEYQIAQDMGLSTLVRNGVDIPAIAKYHMDFKNMKLTIGIVARITAARNPDVFNTIALKFPDFNFVWIGDGEFKHLLTARNIRITGWFTERELVFKELNNVDIYLQTSLWEGLPIAVLEAMALQKPVVATNIIGNKDIVSHNETGFLFDDITELNSYFEILKDDETRELFGKKGLEKCTDLFDKNKNFKELVAIYLN